MDKNDCFFNVKEKALVNPISIEKYRILKDPDDKLGFYDCEYACLVDGDCEAFYISKEDGSCRQVCLDQSLMVGLEKDSRSELVYSSVKIDFAFGEFSAKVNLKYCPSLLF